MRLGQMGISILPARILILAGTLLFVAACGSNKPREDAAQSTEVTGTFFSGETPVFAVLRREKSGSWVFSTVTRSDEQPEKGFLVRLNDLTPAFDTRAAECAPQVYTEAHRCSPTHPFRDKTAGMMDKIINGTIAVGTAGKVTEISQTYETEFDETDFNRAVDEALMNSDLGQSRRRLISLVDEYDADLARANAEITALNQQAQIELNAVDRVNLVVDPTVDGLTEYFEDDIDFDRLVTLAVADSIELPSTSFSNDEVLPCDARRCLAEAEVVLATLRADVQARKAQFESAARNETRTYQLVCDDTESSGYRLKLMCPDQITLADGQIAVVPLNVTILSRDFDGVFPTFQIEDDNLLVQIANDSATFINSTGEYLTLTAQSVYYNSQVHTTSIPIDLPPGISVSRSMHEFVSQPIEIESSYHRMTPDKAAGSSFDFGFAVRYRTASRVDEQTLHGQQSFNVGCAIQNRIRPGSCRTERMAATREPARTRDGAPVFGPIE